MDKSIAEATSSQTVQIHPRRSQRIVKPPEKFSPPLIPLRGENASQKRKRKAEVEVDSSDSGERDNNTPIKNRVYGKENRSQGRGKKMRKSEFQTPRHNGRFKTSDNVLVVLPSRLKKHVIRRVEATNEDAGGLYGMSS